MLNQCDREITMRSKRKELKEMKIINKRGGGGRTCTAYMMGYPCLAIVHLQYKNISMYASL